MAKISHIKKSATTASAGPLTAKQFVERLKTYQSAEELKKIQRYKKTKGTLFGHEEDQ